jgi:hypothetical protein
MNFPRFHMLCEYWLENPPTHISVSAIVGALGGKKPGKKLPAAVNKLRPGSQGTPAELTQAEQWAQHGYMPGVGAINTKTLDEIPATVRKFVLDHRTQG